MYCSIFLNHFYQVFNPVLLVYWSRQWTSNPRVVGSNPPWGKHEFSFFIFCVFFGQKLVYSMLWCIKKDINAVYFIFRKYITIVHLVLAQKWNFPFLSWTSLKWKTENMCRTVVKKPLQNCLRMFLSIFLRP